MKLETLQRHFGRAIKELKRKKTLSGFFDYGAFAFGPSKKDYFLKLTPKALVENPFFNVRYIAFVDVLLISLLVLWFFGFPYVPKLFASLCVLTIAVFVKGPEIETRINLLIKTLKKFLGQK